MIPVLVEMDTTTVSATGLVIPFCSDTCRRKFAVSTDTPAAEGFTELAPLALIGRRP